VVRRNLCFVFHLTLEFKLASQLAMTKVRLLTLREPSVFTFKAEMRFMHKGTKFWTSLVSPKRLNTKHPACVGDESDGLPPLIILVKIEGLGFLSPFSL